MRIRPLERSDVKGGFSCGKPALDSFFSKRAWDHAKTKVSRVYVLEDAGEILGFYTLASKEIERERIRIPLPGSLPKYPLPVFYIGFFAVTQTRQGQGLGRRLMADALRRCAEAGDQVGSVGVFLHSLDDRSSQFYRKLGFVDIPHGPDPVDRSTQPMFLSMKDVVAAKPVSA